MANTFRLKCHYVKNTEALAREKGSEKREQMKSSEIKRIKLKYRIKDQQDLKDKRVQQRSISQKEGEKP